MPERRWAIVTPPVAQRKQSLREVRRDFSARSIKAGITRMFTRTVGIIVTAVFALTACNVTVESRSQDEIVTRAQPGSQSIASYQYDLCLQGARSHGLGEQHIYIAWAAGIAHTCLRSDYPPEQARRSVIQQCERSVSALRARYGLSAPCSIVRDRGRVIDQVYGRALRSDPPLPVQIQFFDSASGNLQTTRGTYEEVATRYNGPNPTEFRVQIKAQGVLLCSGTATTRPFSTSARFQVTCFEQTFSGSTTGDRLISHNGRYLIVPSEVRVSRSASWMSMRF